LKEVFASQEETSNMDLSKGVWTSLYLSIVGEGVSLIEFYVSAD
jgi:hypothetical protein